MIWEPFVFALVLGIIISAGLYFAYLWPQVDPVEAQPGSEPLAAPPLAHAAPGDTADAASRTAPGDPSDAASRATAGDPSDAASPAVPGDTTHTGSAITTDPAADTAP